MCYTKYFTCRHNAQISRFKAVVNAAAASAAAMYCNHSMPGSHTMAMPCRKVIPRLPSEPCRRVIPRLLSTATDGVFTNVPWCSGLWHLMCNAPTAFTFSEDCPVVPANSNDIDIHMLSGQATQSCAYLSMQIAEPARNRATSPPGKQHMMHNRDKAAPTPGLSKLVKNTPSHDPSNPGKQPAPVAPLHSPAGLHLCQLKCLHPLLPQPWLALLAAVALLLAPACPEQTPAATAERKENSSTSQNQCNKQDNPQHQPPMT